MGIEGTRCQAVRCRSQRCSYSLQRTLQDSSAAECPLSWTWLQLLSKTEDHLIIYNTIRKALGVRFVELLGLHKNYCCASNAYENAY